MDQPLLDAPVKAGRPIVFLPSELAEIENDRPFVAIIRSREEGLRWLNRQRSGLQWFQIEGLIRDADFWALVAQNSSPIPLDIVLSNPANDFSGLYRLVDVLAGRPVRVSLAAAAGLFKAVRLAVSLGIPVRILPGQPTPEQLTEIEQTLRFFLYDPMVETPIEFFQSVLASFGGADLGSLWTILEEDPALFQPFGVSGQLKPDLTVPPLPSVHGETQLTTAKVQDLGLTAGSVELVAQWFQRLLEAGGECATCRWQQICQGYFKWPDSNYSCGGVKMLFVLIEQAAIEMEDALAALGPSSETGSIGSS